MYCIYLLFLLTTLFFFSPSCLSRSLHFSLFLSIFVISMFSFPLRVCLPFTFYFFFSIFRPLLSSFLSLAWSVFLHRSFSFIFPPSFCRFDSSVLVFPALFLSLPLHFASFLFFFSRFRCSCICVLSRSRFFSFFLFTFHFLPSFWIPPTHTHTQWNSLAYYEIWHIFEYAELHFPEVRFPFCMTWARQSS